MSINLPEQSLFNELIEVQYTLYSSLFSTLPFVDSDRMGAELPAFARQATEKLSAGDSPVAVVQDFLMQLLPKGSEKEKTDVLFEFLRLVERQVVLFDAIEDSAFEKMNPSNSVGTLEHFLNKVSEDSSKKDLLAQLQNYKVRIVLTAHPTQFYPDAVLAIIADLSIAIRRNDLKAIRDLILQLGLTRFRNQEKPTPLHEARSLFWYIKNIYYRVYAEIQNEVASYLGLNPEEIPALLEIGFWPGGDRDGNPFVTADISSSVAQELKLAILQRYNDDLRLVRRKLTLATVHIRIQKIQTKLNATIAHAMGSATSEQGYVTSDELQADLIEARQILIEKYNGFYLNYINDVIAKVHLFGFYFAALDIRQDSSIHAISMNDVLGYHAELQGQKSAEFLASYEVKSEAEQIETLLDVWKQIPADSYAKIEKVEFEGALTSETLKTFNMAKRIQSENGEQGLHRYITSNSQSMLHMFEVFTLALFSGWTLEELTLDITPLFETIEDLENAYGIMDALYAHPVYAIHLAKRGKKQHIMLGFSDGTKDGGYLAANWGIYRAKKRLTAISRKYGVEVVFFDGRGGPPARGGGNTHLFYRSLGTDVEHSNIHLTIQGQTISSNFGQIPAARFNTEQMFTAGLESVLFYAKDNLLSETEEGLLGQMATTANDKYLSFKNSELFTPYLVEMTPLKYYDRLNVGSRPAKRKGGAEIKLEDLRAIPFVGSWSQIKQNIPGFYGLGTALNSVYDNTESWDQMKKLYQDNLFFRTLIANAMMSLSKTYFPLTAYLKDDARFGEFWTNIFDEAVLTKKLILEVSGFDELLEDEANNRDSIQLREEIIRPLLTIQQYALDRIRASEEGRLDVSDEQVENWRKMVVKSLAANINASRNSA